MPLRFMLSSPYPVLTLLHFAAVPASALNPATAARKGSSVAASLADSCEFRTTDEIEIIPACFLSAPPPFLRWCLRTGAHALSMSWEWCVWVVVSGVVVCCRRGTWLLEYIIYEIHIATEHTEHLCFSLCPSVQAESPG